MTTLSKRTLSRTAIAAYMSVCLALVLLVFLAIQGTYRDLQFARSSLLRSELDRVRADAQRTVGRIERDLEAGSAEDLETLIQDSWLTHYWQRDLDLGDRPVFGALVSSDGKILLHSDKTLCGKRLGRSWYSRAISDLGGDVFETSSLELVRGQPAYDVRVPIRVHGQEVGEYHAGFDLSWFEHHAGAMQDSFLWRRSLFIVGVLLIVLIATTSLYFTASHSISLRRAVDSAALERVTEVGTLAGGLAHEIRNPLQAIRINLHALRSVHESRAQLSEDEIRKALDQSTREIARIEHLMRELVGFATPTEPRDATIDLASEVQEVADFIQQEMLRHNIELRMRLPQDSIWVTMDQGRLRQIMLNLLQNSQQSMANGGHIDVSVTQRRGQAEITVADDGPGISEKDRQRIFDPFYSTRQDGTGLGLALIKRFVEEIGGHVQCERNQQGGATFRVLLRQAMPPRNGK